MDRVFIMITTNFVQSEMLAETYIERICGVKKLLQQGRTDECLVRLAELEYMMQITLAVGELYDIKMIN